MKFHTEEIEGFEINVYALDEHINPRDCFDTPDTDMIIARINDGSLAWFCAKVTASKNGIELASEHLGACGYANLSDFINKDDYYGDMVNTVIKEAKQTIIDLQN